MRKATVVRSTGALKLLLCLALLAAAWSAPTLAAEGDWSQWRGPARDGYAPVAGNERLAAALHGPLPASLHQVWKLEVGLGQSAPILHQGKLYIHVRQGEDEVVLALDPETGEEIWRYAYPVPYVEVNHASAWGPGPKSTLTAVGDTLYTFGVTERLHAIDTEQGDVRWDKNYDDIYKQPYPECGTSASPLVEGDLVIVPVGQTWPDPSLKSLGELVAYSRHTGEEVWRSEYFPPGYASPMAFTIEGVRQIVTTTQNHVVGICASDGKTLWKKEMRIFMEQNIPTPVLYDGKVLIGGYHWGNALLDFEPSGSDELWDVNSVWATKRHELYMDSPVLIGDYVYFRSHKRLGTMVCVDIRTGEQCWRGPPQAARYAAFVVVGEDRLLVLTDNGDIKVLAADPSEYQELASWEVADTPVFTHLTVAGSRMYVKDEGASRGVRDRGGPDHGGFGQPGRRGRRGRVDADAGRRGGGARGRQQVARHAEGSHELGAGRGAPELLGRGLQRLLRPDEGGLDRDVPEHLQRGRQDRTSDGLRHAVDVS